MPSSARSRAFSLLLFSALAWGAMFAVAHDALATVDAVHLSALRYLPAAPVVLAVLAAVEGRRALSPAGHAPRLSIYGTIGFAGFSILGFLGLAGSSPEHAAIIIALMPLVTALVQWLLRGKRPSGPTFAAIAVAFAGVLLVITHGKLAFAAGGSWRADAVILAGVACWAVYTTGAADFPGFSSLRYTALSMGFGALSLLAIALVVTLAGVPMPTLPQLGALAPEIGYLAFVAGAGAVLAWNTGIGTLGAATGALFANVVPIVALAIAVAQGRRFGAAEIAGVLLTLAALVASNLAGRTPAVKAPGRTADSAGGRALQAGRR